MPTNHVAQGPCSPIGSWDLPRFLANKAIGVLPRDLRTGTYVVHVDEHAWWTCIFDIGGGAPGIGTTPVSGRLYL